MTRYLLLQAPAAPGEACSQIKMLPENIEAEFLMMYQGKGFEIVGTLESDLPSYILQAGFRYDLEQRLDQAQDLLVKVRRLLERLTEEPYLRRETS